MKKTLSIIYRICYILFALWILGFLFFPIKSFNPSMLLNYPSVVLFLGLICVSALLFTEIKKHPGKGLLRFKALCSFLSLIVILCNTDILANPTANGWIMCILLPLMLIFDWLIFDKKGNLRIGDLFIWLGILILIGLLLCTILKDILGAANIFNVWGLFANKDNLLSLVTKILFSGISMYAVDTLLSGTSTKGNANKLALLWRILFLFLEGWTLFSISQKNLTIFVKSLSSFSILANFLSFICILAVIIYNLIKYGTIFRKSTSFPRVKGIFTFSIVVSCLFFHFISNGSMKSHFDWILYLIGPLMMFFDWILFDKKGEFRLYEPLIWIIIPVIHLLILQIIDNFIYLNIIIIAKNLVIMLITGLIILILDKTLNRK